MSKAVFPLLTVFLTFYSLFTLQLDHNRHQHSTNNSQHRCFAASDVFESDQLAIPFGEKMGKFIKENRITTKEYKIKTVVIDPGHGGKDEGCRNGSSKEKHIALNVAKKLGASIKKNYPGIKVIYTRSSDVFVPLYKRASIANRNNADLFISLHCNAMKNAKHIKGSETYVMGLHTADENLEVAKRENESILLEDNYIANYDYDPNSTEGHIMMMMYQNAYLEQSILFADKVEQKMKDTGHKSRGVKQAGFVVLRQTAMPSVLVEMGYLTNLSDKNLLASGQGQQKISTAIYKAFKEYKREVETTTSSSSYKEKNTEFRSKGYQNPNSSRNKQKNITFKVQLAAAPNLLNTSKQPWPSVKGLEIEEENNRYKYLVGNFKSFKEAQKSQHRYRNMGFDGAFMVAYSGSNRIDVEEAKRLINEP